MTEKSTDCRECGGSRIIEDDATGAMLQRDAEQAAQPWFVRLAMWVGYIVSGGRE